MERPVEIATALGVVEWYGALRHLGWLRDSGEQITDTLLDVVADECDRRVREWWTYRTGERQNGLVNYGAIEADARAFLTENVDDLDALLAERT